ncbi:MAG: hypothetical protein RLY31_754 [Bacteroidota bacterium]|jgi:magnesium transporter
MKKKRGQSGRLKPPGSAPGILAFTGERHLDTPLVRVLQYDADTCTVLEPADGAVPAKKEGRINWYDVRGVHDPALVDVYGRFFQIHPLVLEDILHTRQRPKFETYGQEAFFVMTALLFDPSTQELQTEQLTLYFGDDFLISFQEKEDDTFSAVRERLLQNLGSIRQNGADYLAYALVDNVADHYFEVLDELEQWMDTLENEIETSPDAGIKEKLHRLKFQLLTLRKSAVPLREAVSKFARCETGLVRKGTGVYLRDLQDHVIRISDLTETYRDMLNGLQELYLAELNIRMNNVIQVLTIITTIFVPLTFLAGLYGMNFRYMPELEWKYGYFLLLGLMSMLFLASLLYFRRKKWL